MAKKIRLSELVRQIEDNELTLKQYKKYFQIAEGGNAFQPRIMLKKSAVDSHGMSATMTKSAALLAHDAMAGIIAREGDGTDDDAKVLAEGDSWFDLPWFYSRTIVDQLNKNHFPVKEIAEPGDTLENMIGSREYERELKRKNYKVFMFSGGGNDLLGELSLHLDQRESGDDDPDNAPRYIRSIYNDTLDRVCGHYETMISRVKTISSRTKIVVHGYAYAAAHRDGPWLGRKLEFRGFDPVDQGPMCDAIIKAMVDAFNVRLKGLAKKHRGRVIYMDFRKDMKKRDWYDELHPRPPAATRLAKKLAGEIEEYL